MFTKNWNIVQLYVRKIRDGEITIDDVPNLFNLREVVAEVLDE